MKDSGSKNLGIFLGLAAAAGVIILVILILGLKIYNSSFNSPTNAVGPSQNADAQVNARVAATVAALQRSSQPAPGPAPLATEAPEATFTPGPRPTPPPTSTPLPFRPTENTFTLRPLNTLQLPLSLAPGDRIEYSYNGSAEIDFRLLDAGQTAVASKPALKTFQGNYTSDKTGQFVFDFANRSQSATVTVTLTYTIARAGVRQ